MTLGDHQVNYVHHAIPSPRRHRRRRRCRLPLRLLPSFPVIARCVAGSGRTTWRRRSRSRGTAPLFALFLLDADTPCFNLRIYLAPSVVNGQKITDFTKGLRLQRSLRLRFSISRHFHSIRKYPPLLSSSHESTLPSHPHEKECS